MSDSTLARRQAAMRERMTTEPRPIVSKAEIPVSKECSGDPVTRSFEEILKCVKRFEGSSQSMISRQDLYDLVWVAPIIKIAKHFGVSDVGLAKTCRHHNIPLPGRGHWAKVEAGQKMPRPPLSETGESWMGRVAFHGKFTPASEIESDEIPEVHEEVLTGNRIFVPETPTELHPIVARAQRDLGRAKPQPDGFLSPPAGVLNLRVWPPQLSRVIAIANALIIALESRGYTVLLAKKDVNPTEPAYWHRFANWEPSTNVQVSIMEERFGFGLSELVDKVPHTPTREEQRRIDRSGRYGIPQYDHVPSGKLSLWLNMPDLGLRGTWSDGKKQRVESCLNTFIVTLIKAAHGIKIARAKEQRENEERQAEEKRRKAYQEWRYEEDKRVRRLDEQLTAWKRAEEVRVYAAGCGTCDCEGKGHRRSRI